jgi:hypothetical protein
MTKLMPIESISERTFEAILTEGKWSEGADDNIAEEQLSESFVRGLVQLHARSPTDPNALAELGVLVLTLSIGEWGIKWDDKPPSDPVGSGWKGPKTIANGKHLMSYSIGGIGLPHLDAAHGEDFLKELYRDLPAAKPDLEPLVKGFKFDSVRAQGGVCSGKVLMQDLDGRPFEHSLPLYGGRDYCQRFNPGNRTDMRRWQVLRHWCRVGLRMRQIQRWILTKWINSYWVKAYNAVSANGGTLDDCFVISRIWNSSSESGQHAAAMLRGSSDDALRLQRILDFYGHESRHPFMKRPGEAYKALRQ